MKNKDLIYKTLIPTLITGLLSFFGMEQRIKEVKGVSQETVVELVKIIANNKCE